MLVESIAYFVKLFDTLWQSYRLVSPAGVTKFQWYNLQQRRYIQRLPVYKNLRCFPPK